MSILKEVVITVINETAEAVIGVPVILTRGEVGSYFLFHSGKTAEGWQDGNPQ